MTTALLVMILAGLCLSNAISLYLIRELIIRQRQQWKINLDLLAILEKAFVPEKQN